MILVVLSDPRPLEAVRTLLRRLCYLLIPLSILLIKYYPYLGKQWSVWEGTAMFVGATTSKNMLGAVCLISGIFFFWDTVTRWPDRKARRIKRVILLNVAFIAMTLWLLNLASSATSRVCLVIGCLVIVAVHSRWAKRHPGILKVLLPATFCLYLILAFGLDLNGELASQVGRYDSHRQNRHLENRSKHAYQSARWHRVRKLLARTSAPKGLAIVGATINESHNGYLEVYLNLGVIGVLLLVGLLLSSYRNICKQLTSFPSLASLRLALWTITLFYNMTEAAFRGGLMWVAFVLIAIAVPDRAPDRVRSVVALNDADAKKRFLRAPLEAASQGR